MRATDLVRPALRAAVATLPSSMTLLVGYHLGWCDPAGRPAAADGGKETRPALALAAARAVGGDPSAAVPAAVAVELVHNFSLLHDDVMDSDVTRRHRPTAWTVFGPNAALLAGNALLSLAYDVLAAEAPAVRLLSLAVRDLLDGQSADLSFERRANVSVAETWEMALGKTGALLGAACALGAMAAGARGSDVERVARFGREVGLAFQLVDDLLGIWGDPAVTGKPVYSDLRRRKKSLPVVAALNSPTDAGTELAALYHREAPLAEDELRYAADLVQVAGGRRWAREQADAVLAAAVAGLDGLDPAACADLVALGERAVRREC